MDDYHAVLEEVDKAVKKHEANEMLLADERVAVSAWAVIVCIVAAAVMILVFYTKG